MDIKGITPRTLLLGVALSLPVFLTSCNSRFNDPFAPRPIGEKFFVPANPEHHSATSLHSAPLVVRATLLKLSKTSVKAGADISLGNLALSGRIELQSITFIGKQGQKQVYDSERIKTSNSTQECRSIESDIKELLTSYPDLTLVCDPKFTELFSEASSVVVKTGDNREREFTSWGTEFSDGPGYRVVFQSLAF